MSQDPTDASLIPRHRPLLAQVISILLGLVFLAAGGAKLIGPAFVDELFTEWGYPLWFQYMVGGFELLAGGLLLFEGYALLGATIAGVIMGGAIATHVHADQELGLLITIPLIVGLAIVTLEGLRLRTGTKKPSSSAPSATGSQERQPADSASA